MTAVNEINGVELKQWMDAERSFQLLDVRTSEEMQQAMIPKGKPLEINNIDSEMVKITKDEELVIYCRSGIRSYQVCEYLLNLGYSKVYNLSGGIIDWYNKGFSLTDAANSNLSIQTG